MTGSWHMAPYPWGCPKYTPWNFSTTEDIYSKLPRIQHDYRHGLYTAVVAPPPGPGQARGPDNVYTGPRGWDRLEQGCVNPAWAIPTLAMELNLQRK